MEIKVFKERVRCQWALLTNLILIKKTVYRTHGSVTGNGVMSRLLVVC